VEVADNGPGIRAEVLERVFDPFVTTKPEGKGTGLGLAISRRLATAMGGELTGRNRRSGGAAFTLALPLAKLEGRLEEPSTEGLGPLRHASLPAG